MDYQLDPEKADLNFNEHGIDPRGMYMSKEEYNFEKAKQGPVAQPPPGKTRITIRVDTDILNWFRNQVHKRGGGNYQTLINDVLRKYTNLKDSDLEKTVRKVIREELKIRGA